MPESLQTNEAAALRSQRPAGGFRLPGPRDRLTVVGRTGSGKTHFGLWALSRHNWPTVPWVLLDYKRDDLIGEIPAREIRVDRRVPRQPGLYVVRPRYDQADAVEALLWRIWARGKTGVYIDEAYMLPDDGALQSLLTQGRSKRIPVISLSQRPVRVNRFVFSEADFYAVFHLNDRRDRLTVGAFLPGDIDEPLPPHHCRYYDAARDGLYHVLPVPPLDRVLDTFEARRPDPRTRWRAI